MWYKILVLGLIIVGLRWYLKICLLGENRINGAPRWYLIIAHAWIDVFRTWLEAIESYQYADIFGVVYV